MDIALKRWPHRSCAALAAAVVLMQALPGTALAAPGPAPVPAPARPAAEAPAPTLRYVVKRGDNLFRLAVLYLARQDDYRTVQRLNKVADPYKLPTGMTLLIPRELLRREPVRGAVLSYSGAVRIAGRPATVGMVVGEGMLVETGQKSFVTFKLPDESSIALPSQSAVRVQRLRRVVLANNVERLFAIERGRASATVTPMTDPYSDFRFATPGAITSVRGTRFRMSYDDTAGRAASEVLEGKVGFASGDRDGQSLPAGYGTTSELPAPVELLDGPEIADGGSLQAGEDMRFTLKPLPGARAYHLQIGADAAFVGMLDETTTAAPEARFASLPDGRYFLRATAIDGNGLEGKPAVYPFERRLNRFAMGIDASWVGQYRQYQFWWRAPDAVNPQFRFQLAKAGKERKPMIDQGPLSGNSLIAIDLPTGSYSWRVMTTRDVGGQAVSQWSDYNELRVEASW